jgi:hypothetical protein
MVNEHLLFVGAPVAVHCDFMKLCPLYPVGFVRKIGVQPRCYYGDLSRLKGTANRWGLFSIEGERMES